MTKTVTGLRRLVSCFRVQLLDKQSSLSADSSIIRGRGTDDENVTCDEGDNAKLLSPRGLAGTEEVNSH
jgi:hypothetical protein